MPSLASQSPARATRVFVFAAVVALTLASLGLRLTGIRFLIPSILEPDGGVLPYQLVRMESEVAEPKREFYAAYYPTLISEIAHRATRPAKNELDERAPLTLERAETLASDEFVRVRRTVACLSVLAVPATYLIARSFLGAGWSLCAAALVAFSFLTSWFAQESRPHAAATSFFAWCMVAALHLRKRGDLWAYALAGLALGASIAALQNGAGLALALLAAVALRDETARGRLWLWIAPALALAVWLGTRFYLAEPTHDRTAETRLFDLDLANHMVSLSGHSVFLDDFDFSGAAKVWNALWGYEPVLLALGALALACFVVRLADRPGARATDHPRELGVVMAFVAPYLLLLCAYQLTYQRFVIPLVPFLAVFGAWALAYTHTLLARWCIARAARIASFTLIALAVGTQALLAVRLAQVRNADDTIERAADWFRDPAHFDRAHQRIAVLPSLTLPLAQTPAALAKDVAGLYTRPFPWLHFQKHLREELQPLERYDASWIALATAPERDRVADDPVAFVKQLDCDFAVVHTLEMIRFHPAFSAAREGLMAQAKLVERFIPDSRDGEYESPLDYEDFEHHAPISWAWRVLFARSTGPLVEIYRLEHPRE